MGLTLPASSVGALPALAAPAAAPAATTGATVAATGGAPLLAPPAVGEGRFDVLVFSKTAGFRHGSIEEGVAAVELLGEENDFSVTATEDASVFTEEGLAPYEAVVWLSTTGDVLDDAQQAAFESYITRGGGYAGVHSASDTEYDWEFYGDLVGAYFASHPAQQTADVLVEDPSHPSTQTLPATWTRYDEWYNFRTNPRPDVHVLASLDESSYDAGADAMGDHPVAWCHEMDAGRSWYTALGHTEESYVEPEFLSHLLGGIETASGAAAGDCGDDGGADEDVTAPTPAVTLDPAEPTGTGGWYSSAVTATLSADDADGSGVETVEYQLVPAEEAGTWDDATGAVAYTGPVVVDEDGDWVLHVRATDAAGNTSAPVVVELRVDTTAPTATLTGVEDGATYGSSELLDVALDHQDATSGVASATLVVDGEEIGTDGLELWTLAPGEHQVTGTVTDVAGNTTVVTTTVVVEVTAADVRAVVGTLAEAGALDDRTEARALRTLERVSRSLDAGRAVQAVRQLEILERSVRRTADVGEGRDVLLDQIRWLVEAVEGDPAAAGRGGGR